MQKLEPTSRLVKGGLPGGRRALSAEARSAKAEARRVGARSNRRSADSNPALTAPPLPSLRGYSRNRPRTMGEIIHFQASTHVRAPAHHPLSSANPPSTFSPSPLRRLRLRAKRCGGQVGVAIRSLVARIYSRLTALFARSSLNAPRTPTAVIPPSSGLTRGSGGPTGARHRHIRGA